ncbi:HNH endonuclease [Agrobacterium pusense]|uniref:HNH endonuclease n=1 Tax=Agrobacterium pusense TaxID=648995 RepID=UPI003C7CA3DE
MVDGAPRVCACGLEVVPYGNPCSCAVRKKAAADAARPSASARGYDRQWRNLRSAFIKVNPTCSTEGCGKPATDVDHIISVKEKPELRLVWSNLRPFCHACHSRHTARTQGFAQKPPL